MPNPTPFSAEKLDAALRNTFGPEIEPHTYWNIAAGAFGGYVTEYECDNPEKRESIDAFIEGYMSGLNRA